MANFSTWQWIGFNSFVLVMLALDLGVFHRKAHEVRAAEAAIWSTVWIILSLAFSYYIYQTMGTQLAIDYLSGYLIEKSLSIDNIFVFIIIFGSFSIPLVYQHRVLFFGILGALVMRGLMIWGGIGLINKFHWLIYIFGIFLLYVAFRTATDHWHTRDVGDSPLMKWLQKYLPVTNKLHGQKFFVLKNGKRYATPLLLVLIFIEFSDLLFAVDSIPAILAITLDPFIVYTSNIFAILGLRSLYFLVANLLPKFSYLSYALSGILGFVGIKMLLKEFIHIRSDVSLGIILGILVISICASVFFPKTYSKHTQETQ